MADNSQTTDLPPELLAQLSRALGGAKKWKSAYRADKTDAVNRAIARLHASGVTLKMLADAFGVSKQRIHQICKAR